MHRALLSATVDVAPSPVPSPPRTRAEAIAAELRRAILVGELAPGDRLRHAEVAERHGVSTTLAELEHLVGRMADASPEQYAELNREFHDRIYAATGRRRLQGI